MPCVACQEQIKKRRDDPPHPKLRVVHAGKEYSHIAGGGHDTRYICDDCGETVIHSTDKADFAWY